VSDEATPADPWRSSGDPTADILEEARAVFDAMTDMSVAELFLALRSLDENDLAAIVLERVLSTMAEARRASG
jgi:hypothetical protein